MAAPTRRIPSLEGRGACALTRAAIISALVLTLVLAMAAPAIAKDYDISQLSIKATLDEAGDMNVAERRTFDFNGDFSWVEWRLDEKGSGGIDVTGVTYVGADGPLPFTRVEPPADQPYSYSVSQEGSVVVVRASIAASDQQYPMLLDYRVTDAVKRYQDVAELYWMAVGEGWPVTTRDLQITIVPPKPVPKSEVRAWAHGPLTGTVSIEEDGTNEGTVVLEAPEVPPSTFVEARVLYPPDIFPGAASIDSARRDEVIAAEEKLAAAANRQRWLARAQLALFVGLPALLALGALGLAAWAFVKYGRDPRALFKAPYLRDDPDPSLAPAVIGALWRMGEVKPEDISATLLDLVNRGIVKLETTRQVKAGIFGAKDESTYVLSLAGPLDSPGMQPLDATASAAVGLLQLVGGDDAMVTPDTIQSYAKAHPQVFTSEVDAFKTAASVEASRRGLLDPNGESWRTGLLILAGVVAAIGIFIAFWSGAFAAAVIPVLCAIPIALLAVFMTRRTPKGAELYSQYRALRDYLRDFSKLDEAPPDSVVLWERFLVLAVVFGIADEVIEQLRVRLPQVVNDPGFAMPYLWFYGGPGFEGAVPAEAFSGGFASAVSTATSQMSSGGGFGGGFSGGGGGGFGGGGGGAG